MLDAEQVRALIVARLQVEPVGGHMAAHLRGQIRALVAVLTGKPPAGGDDTVKWLDAAEIPYTMIGDRIDFPEDWLRAHGFAIFEDGETIDHPQLSQPW